MRRTRAIDLLTRSGASFDVGEFDAIDLTAEEVSAKLGIPLERVFKTLVVRAEKFGDLLAVVPGTGGLNLKKIASVVGAKRAELVPLSEIERLTGYLKGGVSPLETKKRLPVYLDTSALGHERISVSAGLRGLQILIAASDLAKHASATVADIAD